MDRPSLHIKVGGEAGFGIMASGLLLIRTFSRGGYKAITINDYPSLIRGGHNVILVKISPVEIFATDDIVDILIALNRETIDLHKSEVTEDAAIIFDADSFAVRESDFPGKVNLIPVPLMKLTKESGGDVLMRNTVALGAVVGLVNYDFKYLQQVITDQFKNKGEDIINKNIQLAKSGYDFVKVAFPQGYSQKLLPITETNKQVVMTGNEAIGLGAIAAGMKFFAAYPMTPINGLLFYMAGIAEKMGFVYKQPEDEIAGINMAIGASFAGVRSMVATSGGGFSLMTEGFSLAGMIEQPVVIIYGQRSGPATGLPTWTTQGDLHFVLNASQGEFPRLVLAPGDIEEAFYMTQTAFNLADKYQTPVFVLVDKFLCESYFSVELTRLQKKIPIDRGKIMSEQEQIAEAEVKRYLLTDDGISPRPIPGRKNGVFRANSDEHDEYGYSTEEAHWTKSMVEKRMQKLNTAYKQESPQAILYGDPDADHTLVGWGSTKGPVLEAIRQLKAQGQVKLCNFLHINWVNPFPVEIVKNILAKAKHIIDIEGNHNSQMADWILLKTGINIKDRINKYDGRPFYPSEIVSEVKKI